MAITVRRLHATLVAAIESHERPLQRYARGSLAKCKCYMDKPEFVKLLTSILEEYAAA